MNKKIFLIMLCVVLLIGTVSALDFLPVKQYDENTQTITISNLLGLGRDISTIQLLTPSENKVGAGYGKVAEFEIELFDDTYATAFEKMEFYDLNKDSEKFVREFDYKYFTTELVDVNDYKQVCELTLNKTEVCESVLVGTHKEEREVWKDFDTKTLIKGKVTIGIFTDVQFRDYVEWIPTLFGKRILEFAIWTESLEAQLVSYYQFDSGDENPFIDIHGTNNGTNYGATNVSGKLGSALDFESSEYDRIYLNSSVSTSDYDLMTLTAWIKLEGNVGGTILAKDSNVVRAFTFSVNNVGDNIFLCYMHGPPTPICDNTINITAGTWYFVAITYHKAWEEIEFFVNGDYLGYGVDESSDNESNSLITIGWRQYNGGEDYFDGIIDEVGIWTRRLGESEITALYNDDKALGYRSESYPKITLNFPEDNYNSSLSTITFNGTVLSETTNLIENVSLIIDDVYIETNTSGINNSDYTFTKTFIDGDYTWTYEACDNESLCINGTARSFSIDAIIPEVIILAPPTTINHHLININLSVNWSANDTNLDTCVLQFEGVNRTVTCSDNQTQINITNYINRTIIFYVNDTFGHMNSTIRSWNYNVFENSQEFINETLEGTIETFTANITVDESNPITIANFIYNGTSYIDSFSQSGNDTILTIDFIIPDVDADTNFTFYWFLTLLDGQTINLTSYNQTIVTLSLDDCSENTIVLYNYTVVDEGNQSQLSNTTAELNLNLLDTEKQYYIVNFSKKYLETNPFAVCINKNLSSSTFAVDSIVKYEATGYAVEYYNIVNAIITNSTIPMEITLYDLFSEDSTEFKITFKAEDFTFVEDALIYIDRQYIAEDNTFKTVELPKTDSNGQTIGHFVRNDIVYNIRVIKDGVVLGNFKNIIAFCEDYTIGNCQMVLEATPEDAPTFDYDEQLGIIFQAVPTYNEDTNIVSFSFSTDDGTIKTVFMDVTRDDIFGNRTICNSTLTSSSGTLSCSVDPAIDDSVLRVNVVVDGQPVVFSNVVLEASDYGNIGYVIWFLLTFLFILFLGNTKTGVLIGIAISFIGAIALGITRGNIIGIGSAGIWVLVIVILGIVKLNKEKPQ